MANYNNLELRDYILKDARILMQKDPSLEYEDAYNMAKKDLIGDNNVLDIVVKPFEITIDEKLIKNDINDNKDNELYKSLMNKIDITKYDKSQLKQYLIGDSMGIDITLYADPRFSAKQIRFINTMIVTGKDVDYLFKDYDFDPNEVFANINNLKSKQYIKKNTVN